jgi:hypothetical protein
MEDAAPELPPQRRRLLPFAVLGVVTATIAAIVIVRAMSDSPGTQSAKANDGTPSATTTSALRSFTCISSSNDKDDDHCSRQAADYARREPLTAEQRAQVEAASDQLDRVIGSAALHGDRSGATCATAGGPCSIPEPTAARPGDIDLLRTALAKAGMTGAVVRVAGPNDPAPRGAMLYAVPAGPGCVVGYRKGLTGSGSRSVMGHLPDRTCLSTP